MLSPHARQKVQKPKHSSLGLKGMLLLGLSEPSTGACKEGAHEVPEQVAKLDIRGQRLHEGHSCCTTLGLPLVR